MARILVVDDDESIHELLGIALMLDGHEVLHAIDGDEGLAFASSGQPDLIILDVMMPVIDGITMARILRGGRQSTMTPIIMLTARDTDDNRRDSWRAGVDGYLAKPFDLVALREEMERLGVPSTPAA